jgi:hypothetical protein
MKKSNYRPVPVNISRKTGVSKIFLMQLLMAFAVLISVPALCQTPGDQSAYSVDRITYGFETDFASKYLWHGLAFSPGAVSQNSAWITIAKLTGSIWSNYDLKAEGENPSLNELDLALSYGSSFNRFGYEASIQAYLYPDQPESPSTAEISTRLSYDLTFLELFTIQTFDIKEYRGAYFGEFGLGSSWDIGERLSIETSSEIGWGSAKFNETYIGEFRPALELASWEAGATWYFSNYLYLRPHLIVTTILNHNIRALVEKPTLFQFGVAFGGEF